MPKKNRRIPLGTLLIRTAAVLFCLVMVTTYLTAGLYARYTAQSQSGDSARVAKFDVKALGEILSPTLTGEEEPLEWIVDSTGNGEYQITVTNASEVAVRYDVTVVLEEELPNYLSLKLDDGNLTKVDERNHKKEAAGTLAPGGASEEHTLTFEMNWKEFTKDAAQTETADGDIQVYRSETLPFTVKIRAEQID